MSLLPTRRLLWLVLGAAALAAVAGPLPELLPAWLFVLLAVGLAAVGDLAASVATGAAPPSVSAPPVSRFTKGRKGEVRLTFSNPGKAARRLRFALGLPETFESTEREVWVDLPDGAPLATIGWECTPARRGRFHGPVACIETRSRFGLWLFRAREAIPAELRVYLRLPSAGRQMIAMMSTRHNGLRARRTMGRGREFEKLRAYLPGDGFDEIHWKATAKYGHPVTKVFQVERTQELYVILDNSRLSGRMITQDGKPQTVLEGYLAAALVLMLVAQRQGDRFGLIAHDDRVRLFLRAGQSAAHYAACREAAITLEPTDRTPDMAEVVRHLCTHLRRRSLLFILTDLSDPVLAEDLIRNVLVLTRRHLVIVCQMRPPDVGPVFGGNEVESEREIYGRLAGHIRWGELQAISRRLKPLGVTAALLEQETMATELVDQYIRVKQRQAL
jgi:uncharacterized protein (DUF58 family)